MDERKKKLVLLIPQMVYGGAERVVSRLSLIMGKFYDIQIVVFDDTEVSYEVGCDVIALKVNNHWKSKAIPKVFSILQRIYLYNRFKKANSIDITYSFGDKANLVNVLSGAHDKKIISIRGFRRVRTGKGIKERYILKPISKLICKMADVVVSVSELISYTISEEYDIPLTKVKTCYNGYNIENIVNLSREAVNKGFDELFKENRVLVTAGTLRVEKGYWHLLKAFSLVVKTVKDVKLLILGQDYSDNKQKIEKLALELNISDYIIYGGYQSNPFGYFSRSTVYVLPSITEGFPNAMVEAMACKLPVIASDCKSGPREILAPGTDMHSSASTIEFSKYGILVKRMNDVENYDCTIIEECDYHLAEAIIKLLSDEELRQKYASKSFERACDFDYSEWLKRQIEIISE